ncbi:MAG: energy-coupling factor transporter ATPase [Bacillaceae bacterium]|nr:energy-coupling factor transporter ATPase [Bacillaceae bacterium]
MEIVVEHVSHVYGKGTPYEKKALDDISLNLSSGQYTGIIGKTGSGKSTLVQLLNGLLKPTSGRIRVGDTEINPDSRGLRELRKKVGMVFQYPENQLFEETVLKDVMYGPLNFGASKEEAEQKAREALELVGLKQPELYNRSPYALSGGQMRRVALAGVLAMEPDVLILDEPAAGLDPRGKKNILNMIADRHRQKQWTTFLVTHNMEDAARYADWLIVLDQGKIVMEGTPEALFSQPDLLRQTGLEVPEITRFIEKLNRKISPPLPLTIFDPEELATELFKRKRTPSDRIPGEGEA